MSKAHVLSARRPDFRDIITRQASGVTENGGENKDGTSMNSEHGRTGKSKRVRKKRSAERGTDFVRAR